MHGKRKQFFFVASDFLKQIIYQKIETTMARKKKFFKKIREKKNGKILILYQNRGGNPPLSSTVKVKTEFFIQS
jgi:hypothetical protein